MSTLTQRIYHALDGAWRRRHLVVVPIIVLPFLGLAVGLMAPKKYASHTTMLIQETAKMNPFLEDLAVSAMIKDRLAALDTLLHSRFILKGVATTRGLIDDKSSPLQQDQVISRLSASLSMSMPGKDLIRIDYRSDSPDNMKEMLEAVTLEFVEQLMAPERSSMQESANFLAENLELRRRELEEAEEELARFRSRHADELPEMHASSVTRLTELKQRLVERQALLAGARKSFGSLDQQLSKTNPVLGRLEEQIVVIRGELALLLARYTEQHSKVQGALRNLRRLEEERRKVINETDAKGLDPSQLWAIATNASLSDSQRTQPLLVSQLEHLLEAKGRVDSLEEEVATLQQTITELQAQVSSLGAQEQQLSKLQRDLKVKGRLYESLLERYEMARLTGSLGIFERDKRIKLIDRPFTPSAPTNPPLIVFLLAGFAAGIFLGAGLAVVAELLDSNIRRRDELESITGVRVITRIPPLPTVPRFG